VAAQAWIISPLKRKSNCAARLAIAACALDSANSAVVLDAHLQPAADINASSVRRPHDSQDPRLDRLGQMRPRLDQREQASVGCGVDWAVVPGLAKCAAFCAALWTEVGVSRRTRQGFDSRRLAPLAGRIAHCRA
jgi:hypothetical protein